MTMVVNRTPEPNELGGVKGYRFVAHLWSTHRRSQTLTDCIQWP